MKFQFLIGSLGTRAFNVITTIFSYEFQFLIGSLGTMYECKWQYVVVMFQFLIGSLGTIYSILVLIWRYYVSIPYR